MIDSACVLADLGYTFLEENCVPEEDQPVWLTVLSQISLAITTFFLVEIPLTIWAQGLSYYKPGGRAPHSSLHFFDAAVIITTFVLEVILRGRERELAGLLIILRLWRLVKLVQGMTSRRVIWHWYNWIDSIQASPLAQASLRKIRCETWRRQGEN